MSVDVLERRDILEGVLVNEDFGPFGGVLSVWELGTPALLVLNGLGLAIIPPLGVISGESWMGMSWDESGPVAKSESAKLDAKFPVVGSVLNETSFLIVVELLMLVLLNPLVKVAWNSREVVKSWRVDSVLILAGDDQWGSFLLSGLGVEVHASTWLHGGSHRLFLVSSEVWNSVALNNFDIKFHIGVEWNRFSADWSPSEGTTVGEVGWAVKMSLVTLMELSHSKVPAVEHFSVAKGESLW